MPTIREVAKRAEVAPITVSRVINRSGPVSAKTRQRVEAAIQEMGYVPNRLAVSLRSHRTQLVALLLTDMTNPFWVDVTWGIEDALSARGFHMILGNSNESVAREEGMLRSLAERQVDGFILRPVNDQERSIRLIQEYGVPVVVLDYPMSGVKVDVVRGDSEGGAYQLARLLLDLGHRRIAILSGPRDAATARLRVDGYRRAMLESGVEVDPALVRYGSFSLDSGVSMTRQALALDERPTALLAANNRIAFGVLRALRDAGLRVPQDMSVVGFDELPLEAAEHPLLTVAEQAPYDIGRRAAELLLSRVLGQGGPAFQEVILPAKVVFRQSCRPLRPSERDL